MRSVLHLFGLLAAGLFVVVFFPPKESADGSPPHAFIEPDSLHSTNSRMIKATRHISFYRERIKEVEAGIKSCRADTVSLFQQLERLICMIELKANREDLRENLDWWRRVHFRLLLKSGHVIAANHHKTLIHKS